MTEAVKDQVTEIGKTEETQRVETWARFDIVVREHSVDIVADMPGVEKDGVSITVERNQLDVKGRRADYDGEGRTDYRCSFTLGENVSSEGIKAALKHGVLTLEVPKARHASPTRIPIKG